MKTFIKHIIAAGLVLALCFCVSACAMETPPAPPSPAPAETESVTAPEPETAPQESAAPAEEPVSEAADTSDVAAGCEVLGNVYERYYPGTAGSSLKAAKNAAMLLDWYVGIDAGSPSARVAVVRKTAESFAADHDLRPEAETDTGVPINFPEKLSAIWSSAMSLAFGDTMVLDDTGYESPCRWNASDADALFASLYEGLGLERSGYITVYYPDDQVMYLLHADIPSYMDDPSGILYALQTAKVLPREVELLSCATDAEGVVHVDLNGSFRDYICKMGTSGEALTMAGLVDTFLRAAGAQSLRLTVEGGDLETGHAIYDFPLGFEDSFSD